MRMRRLAVLATVLVATAFMPHDSRAPNRWALIVGISDYANFGDEAGGDLPGAAWDARRMRDVLIARWGFAPDGVRLLLDGEATRDRIRKELTDWLPAVAKPGDVVVFYFAGHGSQTWDVNGDEDDGVDETICPTDVLKGDSSRDILDDELDGWLSAIPTQVVVIMDNCNAGTGTRAVTPFARARTLTRSVTADLPKPASAAPAGMVATAPAPRNVLEIAAAQAGEVAVDAEWPGVNGAPSTFGGAFTTTLVRNMWRAPRRTTYEDLYHMTVQDMKRQRFEQRPLLTRNGIEAKHFAAVEGSTTETDDAFVPVVAVSGSTVQLGGGSGAGITVGSVYRAGAAMLTVQEVRGDVAIAAVAGGSAPARGAKAHLVAYVYPDARLRVSIADIADATRGAVTGAVGATSSITFVTNPREFADLVVRPAERGYVVLGMDGATRHTILTADRAAAATALAAVLKREAATHQLALLDNPGQAAELEFGFVDGRTELKLKDEIGFMVRVPRDGYLTIVDLGTDGTITVLYPLEEGQDGRVRAGATVRLPQGDDQFYEAQEPAGRGIVRAFVTERPMDLRFEEGRTDQAATVLQALRRVAGTAPAGSAALPTGSWLTAALVYTIDQ